MGPLRHLGLFLAIRVPGHLHNVMNLTLGNNAALWPQQIFDYIATELPYMVSYISSVDFKKIDLVQGAAIGGISLQNQASGIQAVVPVVIQEFAMRPLDVMILENDIYVPLSESRLIEHLGIVLGKTVLKKTQQRGTGTMPVSSMPPGHNQGVGSVRKYATLFQYASSLHGLGPGALKILVDSIPGLKSDSSVARRMGTIVKDLPYRAVWVRLVDGDWQAVASDDAYRVSIIQGKKQILDTFSKYDAGLANEMLLRDHIFIVRATRKPLIVNELNDVQEVLSLPGTAAITDKNGTPKVGQFFPRVADFSGSILGMCLWFDGDSWAMGEEMSGYHLRDGRGDQVSNVEKRKLYAFSYIDTDGEITCSLPFRVLEDAVVEGGSLQMLVENYYNKKVRLIYSSEAKTPIVMRKHETIIYIPTSWKLHLVGCRHIHPIYLKGHSLFNYSAARAEGTVTISKIEDELYLGGEEMKKMKSSFDPAYIQSLGKPAYDHNMAIWYLANLGFSEGDSRMIIQAAISQDEALCVANILPLRTVSDKPIVDSDRIMSAIKLAEAGALGDVSVDSILGLGMIDDLTDQELAGHLIEIKELEKALSKLLFFARIGNIPIDEDTIKKAMQYVSFVVDQVETFAAGVKEKSKGDPT